MAKSGYIIGLVALTALLCLMVILYLVSLKSPTPIQISSSATYVQNGQQGYGTLPIAVYDPSFLPKAASALWVTFSNSSVYSKSAGWISGGGYGPINLLGEANQSVTVSLLSIPYNSVITKARLGVKSAFMVVNGTKYNVTIPGGSISVNVSDAVFGITNSLILDLSPFIIGSSSQSNTISLGYFTKVYAQNDTAMQVGQSSSMALGSSQLISFYPNISIENATINSNPAMTTIKIGVVNHSDKQVGISEVLVIGTENITSNSSAIASLSSRYAEAIVQKYTSQIKTTLPSGQGAINSTGGIISSLFNASVSAVSSSMHTQVYTKALSLGSNLTNIVYSNISAIAQIAGPIPKSVVNAAGSVNVTALKSAIYQNVYSGLSNASAYSSSFQSNVGTLYFVPSQSGSLLQSFGNLNYTYNIKANSSATLNYSGELMLDNTTSISLVPGDTYQLVVIGNFGSVASLNVRSG